MLNSITLSTSIRPILVASCVSLFLAPSTLAALLIDDFAHDFSKPNEFFSVSADAGAGFGITGSFGEADHRNPALTLGGHRFFEAESPVITGFSGAFAGRSGNRGFFDLYVQGPADPSTAVGRVTWDGNGTLNADLTGLHRFQLDVQSVEYETFAAVLVDRSFDLRVGVSSASGSSSVSRSITTGTGPQLLFWDFTEFDDVDFSSVDAITLTMAIDFGGVEDFERYTLFVNEFTAVPEPLTTAGFSAAALLGFAFFRRRNRRA